MAAVSWLIVFQLQSYQVSSAFSILLGVLEQAHVLKNNEYTRLQRINYASISFSVPETFDRYKSLAPQEELQLHTEVVYKFIASEFIADELELDTSIYRGYVLDDEREGLFYPVPADVNEIIVVSASEIDGHYFQSDPAVIKIMR
jgi:hypothetical protein